ncbi:MAG: bifunctional nuclease family protein [Haloferacaceae archaeon]
MEHEAEVEGIGVGIGDEGGGVPAVILSARGEYLPIFVTGDQARSIELALVGEPAERPLTHDLSIDIITELGGAIDRVRIDDLTDGTFYAKVDLVRYDDGEPEKFVFDARPSDGVAFAVRVDCPITVTGEILDEAGRDRSELTAEDRPGLPEGEEPEGFHEQLEDALSEFEDVDEGDDEDDLE